MIMDNDYASSPRFCFWAPSGLADTPSKVFDRAKSVVKLSKRMVRVVKSAGINTQTTMSKTRATKIH